MYQIPASFAMIVALNSDIGFTCGLTRSVQNNADRLLNPEDSVLKITKDILYKESLD